MPKIFEIGGCVRDELLGIHTKDIDFTFVLDDLTKSVDEGWNLMLDHLKNEGFKIFLETKDCFTVRAQFPKDHKHEGLIADFVMARKEIGYKKGTRKPILELGTLLDDQRRRDFTINTMAKDENGEIIDPFEGINDLKDKLIRTPLNPIETLMEDPLRMLRAIRFSITKELEIEESLFQAMFTEGLLEKLEEVVSEERIREELQKMLQHNSAQTIRMLSLFDKVDGRLLDVIFKGDLWLLPTTKKK